MKTTGLLPKLTATLSVFMIVANGPINGLTTPNVGGPRPSPEMQKLFDAFQGNWNVVENFEISASCQGRSRTGNASFRSGPGSALIEDYASDGFAGPLRFLALLWWDPSAREYRLLTCANNDGCRLRGSAKWQGQVLVNTWTEAENGKTATFRDSFEDISPSGFRLVPEGVSEGKTIWRVTTQYTRSTPETMNRSMGSRCHRICSTDSVKVGIDKTGSPNTKKELQTLASDARS
jgi:hypothetical protein